MEARRLAKAEAARRRLFDDIERRWWEQNALSPPTS
jgi:hypothetical protein